VCCAIRYFQRWQQPEVPLYFCDARIRTISSLFHDNDGHQQLWDKKTEIFGLFSFLKVLYELRVSLWISRRAVAVRLTGNTPKCRRLAFSGWSVAGLPASSAVLSLFSV
jgi:hypothetical protein